MKSHVVDVIRVFKVLDCHLMCGNKNQSQLNLTCRTILVCKLLQIIVNFDGLTFLIALVLGP